MGGLERVVALSEHNLLQHRLKGGSDTPSYLRRPGLEGRVDLSNELADGARRCPVLEGLDGV